MHTLRVLGGFALVGPSGEPVRGLTQPRAEALLAVLAVSGDLGCTRDRILGLLWPEIDESRGRHSLSVVLHAVRQVLGADAVLAAGETLLLNPAVITSDIQQFTRSLAATPLSDALQSYRGPLLDGFHLDGAPEFERWIDSARTRLCREFGEAVERLATRAESAGAWAEAAKWWTRAVEHDPHNTRVVIRLMRALASAGDRANALREAEAHRLRLLKELELPPEPELLAEVARIRDGKGGAPSSDAASVAPQPGAADGLSSPGATQAVVGTPRPPDVVARQPAVPQKRPWRRAAVAAAAILCVVGLAAVWWWSRPVPPPLDSDVVAVLPFSAVLPSLQAEAAHAEAIVTRDLLGGPAPKALEPAVVRRAWNRAGGADRSRDPREVESRVARATGAGLVLRGSLDSAAGGRVLTLTLVELPRREVLVRRSVEVEPGGLGTATMGLVLEVLALEAGQPAHRLPALLGHRRDVVRRFLAGARRYDLFESCRGWLTETWRADSSLVYPGFECLHLAGIWPYRARDLWYDTVAANVWRHRGGLVPEDRAYADALVGPWFGLADDAEARIALWQRAANAAPDWWLPSAHLAFMLGDFGPMTTIPNWRNRASDNVRRALAVGGWSKVPVLGVAVRFAVLDGDSALAHRVLEAMERRARLHGSGWKFPGAGWWFSSPRDWPLAVDAALGRAAPDDRWLSAWESVDGVPARMMFAVSLAVPRAIRYADAMAVRLERAGADTGTAAWDGWVAWHWRARGLYDEWIEHRRRDYLFSWRQALGAIMDNTAIDAAFLRSALYLGAPQDTQVAMIVGRMRRIVDGDSVPAPGYGVSGLAHCWLAQWRLAHGDTTGVGRAIAYLRDLDVRDRAGLLDGLPTRARWEVCPALLEALTARVTGRGALGKARALDRLLRPMPIPRRTFSDAFDGSATHDQTRSFLENLLAARLLASAGDTAGALAAVRRRPWDVVMLDMFEMPSEYLRLEGRLAAAVADTVGAVAAYQHYLGLRPEPPAHPPWRAEWDSVRRELAALRPRT